jgi:hypothetical protein
MGTQTSMFDAFDQAKARMEARFKVGEEQEQLLIDIVTRTVIVDRLVPPKSMGFYTTDGGGLHISYAGNLPCNIHKHALGQLCQKVSPNIPMAYANGLLGKNRTTADLLAYSLEALFNSQEWVDRGGQQARFLHRIVAGELRGFLSHRYARHLATAPLLRAFIDSSKIAGARPVEAASSPVRNALKCLMPKVFEAFPGEHVCVGVEFSNSDFGAGRLTVRSTVWRVGTATSAVLDETFSKVHVGSVIEESDLELSEGTWQKETEAQKGVIVDVVAQLLSEKTIDRLLSALRTARDEQIPWPRLKSRLQGVLSKSDLDWMQQAADSGAGIVDLPPISFAPDGTRVPNIYWASAAVGAIAARVEDTDRRMDLQKEAGKLLAAALTAE